MLRAAAATAAETEAEQPQLPAPADAADPQTGSAGGASELGDALQQAQVAPESNAAAGNAIEGAAEGPDASPPETTSAGEQQQEQPAASAEESLAAPAEYGLSDSERLPEGSPEDADEVPAPPTDAVDGVRGDEERAEVHPQRAEVDN